jgi:predicted DNA-binding protein
MTVQNRISVSFDDEEFNVLERLSAHTQRTKAELIRTIVEEFLRQNPDRFRLKTTNGRARQKNIVLPDEAV